MEEAMRIWYVTHKILAGFFIGFAAGGAAAVLMLVAALVCTAVFT